MGCSLGVRGGAGGPRCLGDETGSGGAPRGSVHRQGGGGFVGGQKDVVGDVVVRVLAGGRVPHVEQTPPGARLERCLRSTARWNPLRLRNGLGAQSSPLSAKLVQVEPETTMWSRTRTSTRLKADLRVCVRNSSAREGSHCPLGCGWPKITPPALWCSARLTTSRG